MQASESCLDSLLVYINCLPSETGSKASSVLSTITAACSPSVNIHHLLYAASRLNGLFVYTGCLLVEMATGIPLFPGQTDIDQLGMITSMVGRLCREHMRIVHNHATLRKMRWDCQPQMRNTLESKFPSLTRHQLQFVKVGNVACPQTLILATS